MISRIMRLRALWFALAMLAAATSAAQGRGAAPGDDQHRPQWQEAKEHHSKDRLDKEIARLSAALQARGYEVGRGSFKLFTIEDCKYPIAALGNCLGNNPAAPYIIPIVPLWADEYVDRSMKDLLGPVPDHTSGTFRLDKREAVLIVGLLPPPARYFGLQTYVFTRKGSLDPEDPVFQATACRPGHA